MEKSKHTDHEENLEHNTRKHVLRWTCYFPPFKEIMKDHLTNQWTDMRAHWEFKLPLVYKCYFLCVFSLKNDTKICDSDVTSSDRASRDENPPLRTAGAMFSITKTTRACRVPFPARKPWTMCAQKSTQRPTLMMRIFMEVMSIVSPHQCMKP